MAEESKEAKGSPNREAKKVFFPFGSSVHTSFNQYAHLDGVTKAFAESLCVSTDIVPDIRGDEDPAEARKKKEKKGADKSKIKVQVNPELLSELQLENGGDQCTKKDCQAVIRKILESQSMNKLERDEIAEDFERLSAELAEQDAVNTTLETRLESIMRDGDQLEHTLSRLNSTLRDLEKKKNDLQVEKDSFNGKKMTLDIERQTWVRQKQEAEAALNAAMWKSNNIGDDTSVRSGSSSQKSTMTIKKSSKKTLRMSSDVSLLTYNSLATDSVMDFLERPKNIPTLPRYLNDQILLPALNQGKNISFFKTNLIQENQYIDDSHSINTPNSYGSTRQTSRSLTGSRSPKQTLKKIRSASPYLKMEGDSYRGYTPTGSPSYRYRNNGDANSYNSNSLDQSKGGLDDFDGRSIGSRSFKSVSSVGMFSAIFNPAESLDPVFYSDKARMEYNRKQPLGQLRVRESHSSDNNPVATPPTDDSSSISSRTIVSKASNKKLVEHLKLGFTGKQGVASVGLHLTSKHPESLY